MPIVSPEKYGRILAHAKEQGFALPAVNVSSTTTINAALQGLAEAKSDGIIQVTTGGADFFAGHTVKNRAGGALAMAQFTARVAEAYPVNVALHTDHCPLSALDDFLIPLLEASRQRVREGGEPFFQSHMWDGSAVPLAENLKIAQQMQARCRQINAILEVEIGVVGGEEDGVSHEINEKLYTNVADAIRMVEALGLGDKGHYLAALTFGNVHGVYKPGNVQLRPELLGEIQAGVAEHFRTESPRPLDLVFHGGSGSSPKEVAEAVRHGVIKMNIDTDTQYAFTRSVADSMFRSYEGVLKVDGEVGDKKAYDPRSWGKKAETAMAARVAEACEALGSAGKTLL